MDISIIGAGPAGNYAAYLLAKQGYKINVFERNSVIGSPVQCTGILSEHFLTLLNPSKLYVQNVVTNTRIYAPNGTFIETKIKPNQVICRKKFDNYLANMAKNQGAKYYLNHSFKGFERDGSKIWISLSNNNKIKKIKTDVLIGADGPNSDVAKSAGLFQNRKFVFGTQLEVYLQNDNSVEFYPHIGCYAWIVPINKDVVRIGVAAYKNTPKIFKQFLRTQIKNKPKIIENQSGVIPVFNPNIIAQKNNIYIIGDAATFVKTSTGGGINQSLTAAQILADSIKNKKDFQKQWKKKMYRNLYMHLVIHKMMQKFQEQDWNHLIKEFSSPTLKKILQEESRDRITKMLVKIMISEPKMFLFLRYFPFDEIINFR